jgi:glutamate-1-semialdehyde 2,1-aminomutase
MVQQADQNQLWFERAQKTNPGGVNSPVRAFKSVGGAPRFIKEGQGALMKDENNQEYIDYIGSWGASILGHAPSVVIEAVERVLSKGFTFGAPTALEVEFAECLCRMLPSLEQVRLVSSGSEATMSALRLARGFTGRDLIIKFEGCYHGHGDSLLVKAGSGLLTLGIPVCRGVPAVLAEKTLVLPFNDTQALADCFQQYPDQIAAVIVEPIAGNMNLVRGTSEFLNTMRVLCDASGSVLIFDEVMTGFRVDRTCAQGLYGITPDLTTLGKVIGGGFPLAAFGGKRAIMSHLAPVGHVYQAGTLSGNPIAVTAGLTTLNQIDQIPDFYQQLEKKSRLLIDGLQEVAKKHHVDLSGDCVGGMFGIFFDKKIPTTFAEVGHGNQALFKRFFHGMLDKGVYFAPSYFEAGFVSIAHQLSHLDETKQKADVVMASLANQ